MIVIFSLTRQIKIEDIKDNINTINNIISPLLSYKEKDKNKIDNNNSNNKNNIIMENKRNNNINQSSKINQKQQGANKNNYNKQFNELNRGNKESEQNYNNIQINYQQSNISKNINNQEERKFEEEDTLKNPKKGRINILAKLDTEKLKKIISDCPKRTSISLNNFREHLKKVTNNLTQEEKAYSIFYWMSQNIK